MPLKYLWLSCLSAKTTEKQSGRVEERTITVGILNDYFNWTHIRQVFKLERRSICPAAGKVYLTDLSA